MGIDDDSSQELARLRADRVAPLEYGSSSSGIDSGGIVAGDEAEASESRIPALPLWAAWILLLAAILLEVLGATSMKLSDGFSNLVPSVLVYVLYACSLALFPFALRVIELSTAYAVWSGLGTVVTALIGFVWFKDTVNWVKVLSLVAITGGCMAINYADGMGEAAERSSKR